MQKRTSIYVLLWAALALSGCVTSAQKSKVVSVNQQEKSAVSTQAVPTPTVSANGVEVSASNNKSKGTSLPPEPEPDDPVTEWGKQTGGKTIRVEFGKNKSRTWKQDGMQVQAQVKSQSAIYKTKCVIRTSDVYLINAKAGQTMTVKITSKKIKYGNDWEEDASFDVFNARTNQRLDGGDLSWNQKLPETGDYAILVSGSRDFSDYTLEITVR